MSEEYPCRVPGCEKSLRTSRGRAKHERYVHTLVVSDPALDLVQESVNNKGGEVTQEKDTKDAVKEILAEEKKAEEKVKREEGERSSMVDAIRNVGDKLDKIDTDVCAKFPELCAKVDRMEEAMKAPEHGSEEWRTESKTNLDNTLFGDCPECGKVRDEVLSAKGKKLADIEAKVDEVEVKVDDGVAKVDEVEEAHVEEGGSELRTSGGWFSGSEWDDEKELYVEQR